MGARLIHGRVEGIDFATVYCPNGKSLDHADFPRKLAWFGSLRSYLVRLGAEVPFVLGGDFNVVPTALDCWRGEAADGAIFCTDEERGCYQSLLDTGLVDMFRHVHPAAREYSWWDYRGGAFHRGMGLRIDMLLGNADVLRRVSDVVIDRQYRYKQDGMTASDHAPVYMDLA